MTVNPDDLPKQYSHVEPEQRWYAYWLEKGYFHSDPDAPGPKYTIVIPPPNVTGALHLGHALNNTLQDILIRFHRMQGYNCLWMPGTDHAGIATQAVVERRLLEQDRNQNRHTLGREKLVARIWDWKNDYEQRILGQLKRIGSSCDWQRTRFTLDDVCARAVRETFFSLFKAGLIYRGKRLVNWDTYLQTAVSDDEVENVTVDGFFWKLKYPVIDPQPGEPQFVEIATTRPETMLGDTAVAVHPDPGKALDQAEADLRAKLAEASEKEKPAVQKSLDDLLERRKTMLPLFVKLRDMAKAGRQVMLPLLNRPIPLVADEWAKPELGTGAVKITPAHDPNDYEVGRRQNLPMINILNPDGTMNDAAGPYRGLTIAKARERVVADLAALQVPGTDVPLHNPETDCEARKIELPMSDRSKTPIEPYLADQWFVKMSDSNSENGDNGKPGLAQTAMDAVTSGRVKITPARYAKTYLDWLSEKRDWPVSRQLWWGHRIPVWHKTRAAQSEDEVNQLANRIQRWVAEGRLAEDFYWIGTEIPAGDPTRNALKAWPSQLPYYLCVRTEADEEITRALEENGFFSRDPDVLDTWFSSALWPHSTLGWPGPQLTPDGPDWEKLKAYYPTSVLVTSRDIITLWVARMVLTGLHNVGEVPFRQVYIHPKILDGFGDTMSKSRGNGVDPLDVIDKFGADSLRFGLADLTTETQDVRMPVDFECPHCHALVEQTRKNRILPRVPCKQCGKEFRTQWAEKPEDKALPRGAVVSERFEKGRNFGNKLWNAARFALMNLEGYQAGAVADRDLAVEDRWILSRLATVTGEVTRAWQSYQFADACRALYGFAWDEFCSFYVEMVKGRLQEPATRPVAQRVLAHTLDTLLRLLHPVMPFITEEIWQLLNGACPQRGIDQPAAAKESVMIAPWPAVEARRQDAQIEAQFARFQEVLTTLRDIRARQNITSKTTVRFALRCATEVARLQQPMTPYYRAMANAEATAVGPNVAAPAQAAQVSIGDTEVIVDLEGLIDVVAELARLEKELDNLQKQIKSKEGKLSNASFVERAPADVVAKERASLDDLRRQLTAAGQALAKLCATKKS